MSSAKLTSGRYSVAASLHSVVHNILVPHRHIHTAVALRQEVGIVAVVDNIQRWSCSWESSCLRACGNDGGDEMRKTGRRQTREAQ